MGVMAPYPPPVSHLGRIEVEGALDTGTEAGEDDAGGSLEALRPPVQDRNDAGHLRRSRLRVVLQTVHLQS